MTVTQTVPLLMLLHELERLRRASGVSAERAARELGCRVSKISRIHLGQSRVTPGDAKLLAELYGAGPELTAVLVDLARNLGQKGDWTSYRAVYRESFRLFLDIEHYSSQTRVVQSEIVPGLLQTDTYVRALNDAPTPFGRSADTDQVVEARRERQAILTRSSDPPMLSFVLSESSLRREYGNRRIMQGQMERLVEASRLPNIQLQVLPFSNTSPVTYASLNFTLLHVPGPGIAAPLDFVYVEQFDDARYLDSKERVAAYEQLWGHLQAAALGPIESSKFIGIVADEYR